MKRDWIIGNGDRARWHLGREVEKDYGGYRSRYWAARCTGKQVYGIFGIAHLVTERPSEIEHLVCKRCDKLKPEAA